MTTFLLVRHAETDAVGKSLAGWQSGHRLNATGKEQAQQLARSLSRLPIQAIYTSPLERAVETAEAIAVQHGLTPAIRETLGEIHFGEWEGRTFAELTDDSEWHRFNVARSLVRAPNGEVMIEVQTRMLREVEELRSRHDIGNVVLVSHLDPLRALVAHYLGMPLDLILRFELRPASVSLVRFSDGIPSVLCLNYGVEMPV